MDRASVDIDTLSDAMARWTGYRSSAYPVRRDAAIADAYPPQEAARLIALIRVFEEEFYRSDAHATASSLSDMGAAAAIRFRRLYPDLPEVIADALAWCYTFDYK